MGLQISSLPWHVSRQIWLFDLELVAAITEWGREGLHMYLAKPSTRCHMLGTYDIGFFVYTLHFLLMHEYACHLPTGRNAITTVGKYLLRF